MNPLPPRKLESIYNLGATRPMTLGHLGHLYVTYGSICVLQEVGNVPYVVENGCGKFSKSPKEIAHIVGQWFGPKAHELQAMSQNALRLARPDSVFKIVQDLHELVKQRSLVMQYSAAT